MEALTDKQLEEIQNHFKFFDRDNNGRIDLEEFAELLAVLSPDSNPEQAKEGFSLIDTNGSGYIEFDEFLSWWKTCWWEY
ncbi:EF-hand domain-containing protein [Kangiella shandongensis]|uniref:EF-hand domain-containing protein n=1 Tax=Kangiella shandongensis TaxID=2763258 RepID=UPI001CBCC680|nr:EF-hand domain-containing protein [Kangiella shandongensis]